MDHLHPNGKRLLQLKQQMKEAYGLNDPIHEQYFNYLDNAAKFDFGPSFKYEGQEVTDIIKRSFPYSLILGLEAIFIALAFGVLFGVIAAFDIIRWVIIASWLLRYWGFQFLVSLWRLSCSIYLQLNYLCLPIARFESFAHTILPAFALATTPLAFIARLMRSSMLEVMNADYIKTAKSKGLSGAVVIYKHALRNAILPVVSYLGPLVAGILTGSFIIEKIFAIPGLGNEFVVSITNRDYTVIMGTTVFFSVLLLVSILIVDLIYGLIDPRIKVTGKGAKPNGTSTNQRNPILNH